MSKFGVPSCRRCRCLLIGAEWWGVGAFGVDIQRSWGYIKKQFKSKTGELIIIIIRAAKCIYFIVISSSLWR